MTPKKSPASRKCRRGGALASSPSAWHTTVVAQTRLRWPAMIATMPLKYMPAAVRQPTGIRPASVRM